MKVVVFGLGYVGAVTAAGLASRGHQVVGVDVDATKVDTIAAGRSPVVEPGIEELIREAVNGGSLRATTDAREAIDQADVSLICVGTPSAAQGDTDLSFVIRALSDLRQAMWDSAPPESGHHSVVIRSTVPPGTGDNVVAPLFALDELPSAWTVGTGMCPEFLREGSGVEDFFAPPFVVVGTADERTAGTMRDMFDFLGQEMRHVAVGTAEALKYACNAFHATKVSFANEIARVFRPHGVDSREVMSIFCEDRKLNIASTYLRPGFAFGGSCLPKDLRSVQHMARMDGIDLPLLSGTMLTNDLVIREVVERIIASDCRKVCILGLSFKANTDDLRESPNVDLAERLLGKGFEVQIYDPIINPERLMGANLRQVEARLPHLNRLLVNTPDEALADAEVVVITSADLDVLRALRRYAEPEAPTLQLLLDLNGRLGAEIEQLHGYQGVGW